MGHLGREDRPVRERSITEERDGRQGLPGAGPAGASRKQRGMKGVTETSLAHPLCTQPSSQARRDVKVHLGLKQSAFGEGQRHKGD